MTKCIRFFINYYGIAPIEVVHKLYKKNAKGNIEEMIDMLFSMPIDIIESCVVPMELLGLRDWPKNDPLYSDKGVLVHVPLFEDNELDYLLDEQLDKEFYIPSVHEIEEFCRIGYEENSSAYVKLKKFFIDKMKCGDEMATTWCLKVWANSYNGELPTAILDEIFELEATFDDENQMREFIDLLMNAHNNTRMKENRGHSPIELADPSLKSSSLNIMSEAFNVNIGTGQDNHERGKVVNLFDNVNDRFDFDEYERQCEIIRKENHKLLDIFEASMVGLSEKTIKKHLNNVEFYLNEFMLYEEPRTFEEGVGYLDMFLGYFFIKKCMWSTPDTIRSTATSIKKFYKCMLDNNKISENDYLDVCDEIKTNMKQWQADCAQFNDPDAENPFSI